MKQSFLGKSPWTTILGLAIAALSVTFEYIKSGETSASTIVIAVLMAVLGRLVKGEDEVDAVEDVEL